MTHQQQRGQGACSANTVAGLSPATDTRGRAEFNNQRRYDVIGVSLVYMFGFLWGVALGLGAGWVMWGRGV